MTALSNLIENRKGISSLFIAIYGAVLAVIILSTLFVGLSISQSSIASYSKVEQERTQERVLIRGPNALNVSLSENMIRSLLVNNTGAMTARIRALYIGGKFICDPSTLPGDSYIPPQSSTRINLTAFNIDLNNTILLANWTVTTERGTKSSETGANLWLGSTENQDEANKFYFGPLLLLFNMFHWSNDGGENWNNGWTIPASTSNVIWRILAADIDERSIILNASSSFALVQNSKQSNKIATWNIGHAVLQNPTQMGPGDWYLIYFSLNGPNNLVDISTPNPVTLNFITIIGSFIEQDNSLSGFAQTIPFEAVKISSTPEIPTYTTLNTITSPQTAGQSAAASGIVTVDAGSPTVPQNSIVMMQYSPVGSEEWENILTSQIKTGSGGTYTGSFTPPHAGTYDFRAMFMGATKGSDVWSYSASALQTITVSRAPSRTTLAPLAPITIGQSITLTATVNVSFATGLVSFEYSTDGGTTYNSLGTSSLSAGTATLTYKPPTPGTGYRFRATYTGDADVQASSTSAPVSLTVNKATPTISTPILNPLSPITLGQSVTASVTFTGVPSINPTEDLIFRYSTDGGTNWNFLCTKTIGTSPIVSDPYTPATVGTLYRIRAEYAGDINYNSASNEVLFTVKTAPTITTPAINPPSPVVYGTPITVTATVSGSYGTPDGTIAFQVSTNGGLTFTTFSTQTLSAGSATSTAYQPPSAGLNYQFRAIYSGDTTYFSATSLLAPLTVTKAPTTTTISLPTTMPANQPITVTAAVVAPPAPSAPAGTVSFEFSTDGINYSPLGNPKTLIAGTATSDAYTLPTTANSYMIKATYNGDTNFDISSSPSSTIYLVSFTQSGVGTDYTGTMLNINGIDYGRAGYMAWFAPNTNIAFAYQLTLTVSSGKQYQLTAVDSNSPITVTSPQTVMGTYQTRYYLTVTSPYGSTSGQDWYNAGTTAIFSINPTTVPGAAGTQYVFTAWSGSSTSTNPTETIVMNNPATMIANWQTQYAITATSGPNGSIDPSGTTFFNAGSSQTYTITPIAGYHIDTLLIDGTPQPVTSSYIFSNIAASHSIAVTFAIDQFTITTSSSAGGTISPSGSIAVNYGSDQMFTIAAESGYTIDTVTVDGVSVGAVSSYTFTNVTVNHTIDATFRTT